MKDKKIYKLVVRDPVAKGFQIERHSSYCTWFISWVREGIQAEKLHSR